MKSQFLHGFSCGTSSLSMSCTSRRDYGLGPLEKFVRKYTAWFQITGDRIALCFLAQTLPPEMSQIYPNYPLVGWSTEGLETRPFLQLVNDDRWYNSHRPKPIFTQRALLLAPPEHGDSKNMWKQKFRNIDSSAIQQKHRRFCYTQRGEQLRQPEMWIWNVSFNLLGAHRLIDLSVKRGYFSFPIAPYHVHIHDSYM